MVMRCFNTRQGLARKDDYLPAGLSTIPKQDGPGAGATIDMDKILNPYYELRGWDSNGIPTREKLEELGLGDMADALDIPQKVSKNSKNSEE